MMEVELLREIAARFHRILDIVLDEDFSAPSRVADAFAA